MELWDYQQPVVQDGLAIMQKHKLLIMSLQMRVGKTPISLSIANEYGAKQVLFITTKKVLDGGAVQKTKNALGFTYSLEVINYESLHKVTKRPDFIIVDEAQKLGAYPKPGVAARRLKGGVKNTPIIYLSGTMTPESWSQIYHILFISDNSPFVKYKNFYAWANDYVNIQDIFIGQQRIKDYSKANIAKIKEVIAPYTISMTQEEAGFETVGVNEIIHYIDVDERIPKLIQYLIKNKMYVTKDGKDIIADTPAKLMSKHHQLVSGTVITEDKEYLVICKAKAEFIKTHFAGKQVAIYYMFKSEYKAIVEVFGEDNLTSDEKEFKSTQKNFVSQFQSGREGIDLSNANDLILYTTPYSYLSWSQTLARLQNKNKVEKSNIHYLVANLPKELSMELKILNVVKNKEVFTSSHYKDLID